MNKFRILFILHLPPPIHGAAMMGKYIHDSDIINNSFDCHYINLTLAKDMHDIGKGGFKKLFSYLKLLYHIHKEVKEIAPDLCYVTPNAKGGAFYKDFIVVMMLKALKQKVVIHYHNKGVATKQDNFLDNILYKLFFKNLKVILLAEELYSDIQKYVRKKDIYICPNGIPEQKNNINKTSHKEFNILFLSNMMQAKGVWDLIRACKLLKEKGKEFKCFFVGKWSDISEEHFITEIYKLGLENIVHAYGAKYGKEKTEFLEKTDVFVFPTLNEAFGLVLLEAMEYEIPCIATNEGGIPSIVNNNETGFIINKNNPTELADKIEYMIEHPDIRHKMGSAGKLKFINKFTIKKFENRIKDIFNDILITKK